MKHSRPVAAAPQPIRLPLPPGRVWRLLLAGFGGLTLAAALVWATALGVPQRLAADAATRSARAGFGVRQVLLSGVDRQPRIDIYREVLAGGSDAMVLLDPGALRTRINALPWVADSEVRRQWPDTLRIHVVERQPVAIWQRNGRYRLIDREGRVLPATSLEPFRGLPLVVGEGAPAATGDLIALLAAHDDIARALLGAVRVSGRRWDLRMRTGETIALPPDREAASALRRFAAAQAITPVLGQGFLKVDLRIEGKMAVRLRPEALIAADERRRAAERAKKAAERQMPPAGEARV
jgi:cell division protein FtsQ